MLDFERKTEAFIRRHSLLEEGDYVVAAVSGGPDSIAMLDFFVNRMEQYKIKVCAVHVNHMLRGEDSLKDLKYVQSYCEVRGIPFKAAAINIKEKMAADHTGLQETARAYRYRFFEEVMHELGADKLAVGQHGDDQIETILMRLTRGSRGVARAGIQPKRSFAGKQLIRPLLDVSKAEIEKYCTLHHLNPRIDMSNKKPDYTRNRFRLEVLPFLKSENEHVHEHFQRLSEDITEDEKYLQALAKEELHKMCQEFGKDEIALHIPSFCLVALPLQRRVIHLILNYLYEQKMPDLTALHIELIQRLLRSENPSGQLDFPFGLKVIRSYERCIFTFSAQTEVKRYHYELYAGEEASLPDGSIIRVEKRPGCKIEDHNSILILNPDEVEFPIKVRTRRPGDRMRIRGMDGSKKVKNIFIDMKIPVNERAAWPIITDHTGNLLWVPGLKKSCYHASLNHDQYFYVIYYTNQISPGGQPNE